VRRERDLPRRHRVTRADDAHDLRARLLERDLERREHLGRDALLFAQQPEQEVLGADVVVAQLARLVLREDDDLACSV
jgi:hypothetical protein